MGLQQACCAAAVGLNRCKCASCASIVTPPTRLKANTVIDPSCTSVAAVFSMGNSSSQEATLQSTVKQPQISAPDARVLPGSSGHFSVEITGGRLQLINADFDPSNDVCCGQPVYCKRGSRNSNEVFLEFNSESCSWQVKPAEARGQNSCWAMLKMPSACSIADCVRTGGWRELDGSGAMVDSPNVELKLCAPPPLPSVTSDGAEFMYYCD